MATTFGSAVGLAMCGWGCSGLHIRLISELLICHSTSIVSALHGRHTQESIWPSPSVVLRRSAAVIQSHVSVALSRVGSLRTLTLQLFNSFCVLTVLATVLELYLISKIHYYYESTAWLLLVGYVGANHFLYGLHSLAGTSGAFSDADKKLISDLAGVGGMLKSEESHNSWSSYIWDFSKHRCTPALHMPYAY
mmetsp:Transcript_3272/g.9330  ORF Transcript_3272/g.9330 Transcript_3272/m.9330 type:complete len:193 (-) Transcript_3272:697-1275(-)